MAAKELDGVNKTGVEGASPPHSGCPHVPLTMIRLGRKSRSHHEAIIIREIRMMMMSSNPNPNPTLVLMLLLMMIQIQWPCWGTLKLSMVIPLNLDSNPPPTPIGLKGAAGERYDGVCW